MESESTDGKIAENTKETSHPWNALTTVTAFDQGTDVTYTSSALIVWRPFSNMQSNNPPRNVWLMTFTFEFVI